MTGKPPLKRTSLKARLDSREVFLMLSDPFRRRIIFSLANGGRKTAAELNRASGKKRHAYLKHLSLLCKAGFLCQAENVKDRRQPLYALVPEAIVSRIEGKLSVDFGCCMLIAK